MIQAGAVLAVFLVFSRRVKTLLFGLAEPETRAYLGKLALAFVLTIVGVLIARKLGVELPKDLWPIAWATVWGGVLILIIEWSGDRAPRRTEVTWGIAIVVARRRFWPRLPGTRAPARTILFAIGHCLTRAAATEFSFPSAFHTMCAASAYAIYRT